MSIKSLSGIIAVVLISLAGRSDQHRLIHYVVLSSGDTINRMTDDSTKHGRWYEDYTIGQTYYYEVGNYIDNLRFGEWRVYNEADEMIEKAQYFRGAKNGPNTLYTNGFPHATGEQVGMFYTQDHDTIMVTDPEDLYEYATEIENNSYALRNGEWIFRNPFTHDTTEIITYHYGKIIKEVNLHLQSDPERDSIIEKSMPHRIKNYKPISKKPRRYHFPD